MNAEATVKALSSVGDLSLLTDGRGIGLEKESLRVTPEFTLSPEPPSQIFRFGTDPPPYHHRLLGNTSGNSDAGHAQHREGESVS